MSCLFYVKWHHSSLPWDIIVFVIAADEYAIEYVDGIVSA